MTKPYSYQKWRTSRTWPGGGWGEAMAQVRKDQHLSQRDIADYMGVSLGAVRKWEEGVALPERLLWPKLEEAMGMPVPDPRIPEQTPAERELIDTMLLMIDELRLLRERMAEISAPAAQSSAESENSKLLDVNRAADYLGISSGFIRNLVAQRSVVHYKLGGRVMFAREDLDQFVAQNRREPPDTTPWQLRRRRGASPRTPAKEGTTGRSQPAIGQRRLSKSEIADERWKVTDFADRWWGLDSARALLQRAGVALTEDTSGAQTFRYGDLVEWMESHRTEFDQWRHDFDPSLDPNRRAHETDRGS